MNVTGWRKPTLRVYITGHGARLGYLYFMMALIVKARWFTLGAITFWGWHTIATLLIWGEIKRKEKLGQWAPPNETP